MLQLPTTMMNGPGNPTRAPRSRTGTPDRGGIRKRGRIDRDGDLDMAAGGGSNRGRGRKSRGQSEPSRRMPVGAPGRPGRRPGNDKDKTLDALQKAIFNGSTPQANIRQTRSRLDNRSPNGRGGLAQIKIRGWKESKVASNADGRVDNLISFLERKATPPPDTNSGAHVRLKISKVCATSRSRCHRRISQHYPSGSSSFSQANTLKRRLRPSRRAANAVR